MNRKTTAINRIVISWIISIGLVACGGNKVVTTVDDSADYQSAKALPPLNKKLADNDAQESDATPTSQSSELPTQGFVSSELMSVSENTSRLRVDLPLEESLDYLSDKLVASGLTVHHKNNQAARISIGCGDIASAPSTKKKSRWTLAGRRTIGRLEYCALELDGTRNGTVVKVIDLNQQEVDKSHAEKIFQRILVN